MTEDQLQQATKGIAERRSHIVPLFVCVTAAFFPIGMILGVVIWHVSSYIGGLI